MNKSDEYRDLLEKYKYIYGEDGSIKFRTNMMLVCLAQSNTTNFLLIESLFKSINSFKTEELRDYFHGSSSEVVEKVIERASQLID